MKKIAVGFALCVALLLASCGKKDYRNLLPADASTVLSVNPAALARKANVDDPTRTFLYRLLEQSLDEEMPEADRQRVLALAADPERTGLDMSSDLFFFGTLHDFMNGSFSGGMLGKVKDPAAVRELLEWAGVADRMTEEGGLTLVRGAFSSGFPEIIAFDREAFLMLFSTDLTVDAEVAVRKLFAQKRSESLMRRPELAHAFGAGNDIVMMMDYGALVSQYVSRMGMGMTSLPGMEFLSGLAYVAPVNFEKGRIVSEVSLFFDTEEAAKQYREFVAGAQKIDGGFLKSLPGGNVALGAWSMNGARVYRMLQQIPTYSMLLAMAPQAQTILEAIDGDVAFAVHGFDAENENTEMTFLATTANSGIVKSVLELAARAREYSPGVYRLKIDERHSLYFGERDGRFYATTVPCMAASLAEGCADFTDASASEKLFRGAYSAMKVDFQEFRQMLSQVQACSGSGSDEGYAVVMQVLSRFERVEVRSDNPEHGTFEVRMIDKERNAAETIFSMIEEFGSRSLPQERE